MVVYPHIYDVPGNVLTRLVTPDGELAVHRLIMYGAEVVSDYRREDVTHVLVVDNDNVR
jgi:hypothetical protein